MTTLFAVLVTLGLTVVGLVVYLVVDCLFALTEWTWGQLWQR